MNPIFQKNEILDYLDEDAEKLAFKIYLDCSLDKEYPDAAVEAVSDFDFDELIFDDFIAEYVATESITTNWGKLINYEKEIKMAGNAMSKAAGEGINLLLGTDGFTTSAPRKKDGQYYTRATLAFSDGQAVRILFYNPDKPEERHKYPTNVVSFQVFLNKKDITASLVKGGGKDYGPRKFGKIIGKLLERNSEKFQKKNAEIRDQKEEIETLDKETNELDEQIATTSNEVSQSKERNVFLKKQHADLKTKAETAATKKAEDEKLQKAIDESTAETIAGKTWVEGKIEKFVGKKYDPEMTTKDVAKSIREEIKAAQKAGQIIDAGSGTYSVTMERFSMGSAVNVYLKKIPEGVELYSDTWKEFIKSGSQDIPDARLRYSDTVKDTLGKIENIVNQYNKTSVSTEPDDYSNVSFYPHVGVDSSLEKSEGERIRSEVETGGEVETTEPRDELIRLLTDEINQLKADPDTPEFKLGLRVGKKKDGTAGKVSLDLKETDVSTMEELNALKTRIEDIVKSHTKNYSFTFEKAERDFEVNAGQRKAQRNFDALRGQTKIDDGKVPGNVQVGNIYNIGIGRGESVRAEVVEIYEEFMAMPEGKSEKVLWAKLEMVDYGGPSQRMLVSSLEDQPILPKQETEPPQQEQVEDTGITQAEIPPEEAAENKQEIGSEYKDRKGVTKLITHQINDWEVSAVQQNEYVLSAYLRNREWINLPIEQKTLISETDLKGTIAKSEEAYQIADDILNGNYDSQGHEKVDQLLDEIAEVIEDESKLNQIANYLTKLITKKFAVPETEAIPA